MNKFLIDENLSPQLARWLKGLGYDARAVRNVGLKGKSDEEIIRWLQREKNILITSDLDFGEIFYLKSFGGFGVIVLRGKSQSTNAFKAILAALHNRNILKDERLTYSLLVSTEKEYRWRKF